MQFSAQTRSRTRGNAVQRLMDDLREESTGSLVKRQLGAHRAEREICLVSFFEFSRARKLAGRTDRSCRTIDGTSISRNYRYLARTRDTDVSQTAFIPPPAPRWKEIMETRKRTGVINEAETPFKLRENGVSCCARVVTEIKRSRLNIRPGEIMRANWHLLILHGSALITRLLIICVWYAKFTRYFPSYYYQRLMVTTNVKVINKCRNLP